MEASGSCRKALEAEGKEMSCGILGLGLLPECIVQQAVNTAVLFAAVLLVLAAVLLFVKGRLLLGVLVLVMSLALFFASGALGFLSFGS